MKNIFRFKKYAKVPDGIVKPAVVGITTEEWVKIHNTIEREREAAKQRQRRADGKPSDFMRGLDYALSVLDNIKPHVIKEV